MKCFGRWKNINKKKEIFLSVFLELNSFPPPHPPLSFFSTVARFYLKLQITERSLPINDLRPDISITKGWNIGSSIEGVGGEGREFRHLPHAMGGGEEVVLRWKQLFCGTWEPRRWNRWCLIYVCMAFGSIKMKMPKISWQARETKICTKKGGKQVASTDRIKK